MRRFILLIVLCSLVLGLRAQNSYLQSSARYRPQSFEEMLIPHIIATRAHNEMLSQIDSLKAYIVEVLGKSIDWELRCEMNFEYKKIQELSQKLERNGLSQNIRTEYNSIKERVQEDIVEYNNRVAQNASVERPANTQAGTNGKTEKIKNWSGTGFALKNNYIVTNYHVVEDAKSIYIQGVNGNFNTKYNASIVATDKFNDLAILKVEGVTIATNNIPYSVKTSTSEVGEDVFVLGYPLTSTMGEEIKLTTGVVSSKTGFQGDVSLYQVSAPIQPGNSGGPLFDGNGNVIGVVSAKHKGAENVGYAIKASYLKNLMESSITGNILPQTNKVANHKLSDQVKSIKNYVYYITCSTTGVGVVNKSNYTSDDSFAYADKTYNNPYISINHSNGLKVLSVSIRDNQTVIAFSNNNLIDGQSGRYYQWMRIDKNAYIEARGQKYKLVRAEGIAIAPEKTYFSYAGETITFTLYFPAIPKNTTSINFIESEDSDWQMFGIKLQ